MSVVAFRGLDEQGRPITHLQTGVQTFVQFWATGVVEVHTEHMLEDRPFRRALKLENIQSVEVLHGVLKT